MHIYLQHPVHGSKVAIAESEAVADERNGWTRYTLDTVEVPDFLTASPINTLHLRRPGRPRKVVDELGV